MKTSSCPWRRFLAGSVMFACLVGRGLAADATPEVDPKDLPRLPPVAVADTMGTFQLKAGLKLEVVAAEPLVRDPIEICFDENGRMFVVEMIDYSERRNEQPHLGRINLLEDTDGDGRYDKSTIFVDDLPWPTGIFWANGGLYVAATPDIFFCQDTNGDGKAETRTVVYTGFGIDFAPYAVDKLNMRRCSTACAGASTTASTA